MPPVVVEYSQEDSQWVVRCGDRVLCRGARGDCEDYLDALENRNKG